MAFKLWWFLILLFLFVYERLSSGNTIFFLSKIFWIRNIVIFGHELHLFRDIIVIVLKQYKEMRVKFIQNMHNHPEKNLIYAWSTNSSNFLTYIDLFTEKAKDASGQECILVFISKPLS